jgi:hypothetical protein
MTTMAIYNLGYNLPINDASTPIVTFVGFHKHPPNTNINLVFLNLKMERLHLFNRLGQLHDIDRRLFNQSVSIPHLEPIEPQATPKVVQQGVTYPQGT